MLLTTMIIVHQEETELPKERVVLYERAVNILLRKWEEQIGLPADLSDLLKSPERLRPIVERLAFETHLYQSRDLSGDLPRTDALTILEDTVYLGDIGLANRFLNYVDERSGLLVGRGGAPGKPITYSFPHRTFQEYLAGCYLVNQRSAVRDIRKMAKKGNAWTVAVQLGAGELLFNRRNQNQLLDNADQLLPRVHEVVNETSARETIWSAHMAHMAGKEAVERDEETGTRYLDEVRNALVASLKTELPPIERAEAGRLLAHLGDPRKELLTIEHMRFCFVPAGPFVMGSETDRDRFMGSEIPQSTVNIPWDYWISESPVTQSQYAAFMAAGGYQDNRWWTEEGHEFIKGKTEPRRFGEPFELPNHPVVGVSWYEALAFTRWLTHHAHSNGWLPKDRSLQLPNEAEWEKAARGREVSTQLYSYSCAS